MQVKPIADDKHHAAALEEIRKLMDCNPAPESPLGQYLKALATVVEEYEKVRWPMEKPTSEEMAAFRAEQEKV
jgi:HTH-type transcriptional regulator / antitoxin HigA